MSEYDKLKSEFDEKVKTLQKRCSHKKKQWMEYQWAIGHSTGKEVLVCLNCNKILESRGLNINWNIETLRKLKKLNKID